MTAGAHHLRDEVYEILERPSRAHKLSWIIEIALIVLIILNVIAVALETVQSIYEAHRHLFLAFDIFSVIVFTIEYVTRVWASPAGQPDLPSWKARLRYMRTPMAVIDLAAILPFYLSLILPIDLRVLRMLRLLRIYKLARYSPALQILVRVIREEAGALIAAFSILSMLLVLTASGAYLVEHKAQPEAFGSVPAAMWWAIVTLTTVGYGDVTPITTAGRVFGAMVTVLGVGMAALPAGIIASGLGDHLHRRRDHLRNQFRLALEDGKIDITEGRKIEELRRKLGITPEVAHAIHDEVRLRQSMRRQCTCPNCGHNFEDRVIDTGDH